MVAAVPGYIDTSQFKHAPPGHRFRLYFDGWEQTDKGLEVKKSAKDLFGFATIPPKAAELLTRLRERHLLACAADDLVLDALTTSPFVTGMGMEHPIENGFAFLDPYGLPYLPGSSVKGVVRRAGEELALFGGGDAGWRIDDVWWIFGLEGASAYWRTAPRNETPDAAAARLEWQSRYREAIDGLGNAALLELDPLFASLDRWSDDRRSALKSPDVSTLHSRGALELWDVLPDSGGSMRVDVMTPHFQDYFQKNKLPTDDQKPLPICFLALPEKTKMRFVARWRPTACTPDRLGRDERWKELVGEAFEHAFDWLGFGAKTTAGYGRLAVDEKAEQQRRKQAEDHAREVEKQRNAAVEQRRIEELEARRAAMSPVERNIDAALDGARRQDDAAVTELYKLFGESRGDDKLQYALGLREAYKLLGKWEGKHSKKQQAKVDEIQRVLREGGRS